ncbi:hypothetical protein [Pseudophaeobacter sp.]|uniref:hypothetical protein n=1 Tax=Pseudophaeobacter sp. TaxID=1971739 RepID=UPI002614C44B|nr:hypothetical protein [Pseudophaeobacter sp.]
MADEPHIRERIEADKRRKRDTVRQRNDHERKEELDDKAEAAASAVAMAVASSPPAAAQQIAAFEADLTIYDTATVDALMANDRKLAQAQAQMDAMLTQAFVTEDGRRVFRTEEGTQVFDEFGTEVGADELDPASIPDHHPTWEAFSPARDEHAALLEERQTLLDYQQQLDDAREALVEGEITEAELEELQAQLIEGMPEAVRASLPDNHPAAQIEAVVQAATTPNSPTTDGPSLDGLQGFAPPTPPGA